MTAPVAGIAPHQPQFTVGIIDAVGVELACDSFPNTARGFIAAIDLLATHVSPRSASTARRVGARTSRSR